ncbi:hypothetical protein TNCV_1822251 [Trichonephila clavipes]|nr:hypothetical protein TNCV_1822251 [Trichonephila clavipes]
MDMLLAIAQLEKETEKRSEITDNKSNNNYKNVKFESIIEDRIKSDISIPDNQNNIEAFSSGMEETSSLKTYSSFTLRTNISESSEQSSKNSSVTSLVQGSKYVFYDDNGKKFIIDNATFEAEEKELIDIFNLNSSFPQNNPNFEYFENRPYNEDCHFYPISTNASKEDNEDAKENVEYHTDEEVEENTVDSSQKKNIFSKMKSLLKKVRTDKCIGVSYQRFK